MKPWIRRNNLLAYTLQLALTISPQPSLANPISSLDSGVYAIQGKEGEPLIALLRLSVSRTSYTMEGQHRGDFGWSVISCGQKCQYRESVKHEIEEYERPLAGIDLTSVNCIQNVAQAFCRIELSSGDYSQYLLIALTGGKMIPVPLHRLE